MLLQDLPPELIEHILTFLPASDIFNVGQSCRKLRNVTFSDPIWEKCIKRDFLIDLICDREGSLKQPSIFSARQFYVTIIMPFGLSLLNIWQLTSNNPYGGLVKFLYHDWL